MPGLLWTLAIVFAPLSLMTIGGGQSAVADIHRQVVNVHQWMSQTQFVDAFAISRMAPGPGSLLVTLIGWQVAGVWGAAIATIAIFTPTAFLTYGIAHIWALYEGARWQRVLEAGLRPVAAGMVLAGVYILLQALDGGWYARFIAVGSAAVLMMTPINPILLIGGGASFFVVLRLLALL